MRGLWKESPLPRFFQADTALSCVFWLCCMAKSYHLAQMGSAADPACISPSAIDCSSHFRGNWSTCYLDTGRLEIEIHFSIKLSCALSFVLGGLCVWPGLCYIQPGALSEPQQLVWGFHLLNRCCIRQRWMCLHSSCLLLLVSSFKIRLGIHHVQCVWNNSVAGLTFNLVVKPLVTFTGHWKE